MNPLTRDHHHLDFDHHVTNIYILNGFDLWLLIPEGHSVGVF